jgi:hypothetical protein
MLCDVSQQLYICICDEMRILMMLHQQTLTHDTNVPQGWETTNRLLVYTYNWEVGLPLLIINLFPLLWNETFNARGLAYQLVLAGMKSIYIWTWWCIYAEQQQQHRRTISYISLQTWAVVVVHESWWSKEEEASSAGRGSDADRWRPGPGVYLRSTLLLLCPWKGDQSM